MWRKFLIGGALMAVLGGALAAQESKPKGGPPDETGVPMPRGSFGRAPTVPPLPDDRDSRGRSRAGSAGERVRGPVPGNGPFGGRGGPGVGALPGEFPGFRPGFGGGRGGDPDVMRQQDPEMFALVNQDEQLEQQSAELADRVRRASAEQRDQLKTQLKELVNKHFEIRQQRRELQLKRMETELARLREAIKERNEARDSIIQLRLTELTGDVKDLGF
jgi:hypothetical protein